MSALSRIVALARAESRVLRRNRWLVLATLMMVVFSLALSLAGSAPTGTLGVDMLTVSVASITTLAVYLVPLLALLISFDAIAGERDRGTLGLILSSPASRAEILLGKAMAQLAAITFASVIGFGSAGVLAALMGGTSANSVAALIRLMGTAVLLGGCFVALGYLVSALAGSATAAAGMAAALWLVFVVLFDLALLGAVVMDGDGVFTRSFFPWIMTANPADAFRLWNISGSDSVAIAAGMTGVADNLPRWAAPLSLVMWPLIGFLLAHCAFQKVEP